MGTPQYMSPEQAQGRIADMDARSVIFSLGGILYCILSLRPPVEGKTLVEILVKGHQWQHHAAVPVRGHGGERQPQREERGARF